MRSRWSTPTQPTRNSKRQLRDAETRALQQAVCRIWKTGDGTTRGTFTIPDLTGDLLLTALNAFAAPRRDRSARRRDNDPTLADPADGSGSTGAGEVSDREPDDMELERLSYPQRLGRALVELAEHLPVTGCPNTAARTPPWSSPPT